VVSIYRFTLRLALGLLIATAGLNASSVQALAQGKSDMMTPFPAFRIAGNLYYVGSKDLASYLVTTPSGDILINSSFEASVPLIQHSIESLGFKLSDVKILLISHAHDDHDAGSAKIKKLSGAQYMVMDADVPVVESGKDYFYTDAKHNYPPAKVDRVLHDGDQVKLGDAVLVAHKTPGHTKGCTTWTMKVTEKGRIYNVVIVGSWNVNAGYRLVGNTAYPEIAADYEKTFRVLNSLPCDIFLGAHGAYFDLVQKYDRMQKGDASAFVDPAGYKATLAQKEADFRKELARQESGGK
jgi:metallo-beta-lactamase class B